MKFYEICVEDDSTFYSAIVCGDGQILRTDLNYKSGLTGSILFDPAVEPPASWMDSNCCDADLYYTTEEFLVENFSKGEVTVKETAFRLPYKKILPCKCRIGDRKIIKPVNVLAYLNAGNKALQR